MGKGASDGGSVGVDRSDCVLYPTYTPRLVERREIELGLADSTAGRTTPVDEVMKAFNVNG